MNLYKQANQNVGEYKQANINKQILQMQTIRNKLNNLPIKQKQKYLSTYIFFLVLLVAIVICSCYWLVDNSQQQQAYTKYIKQYSKRYSPMQQSYRRFIFYQTYNDIIFHKKNQLDQKFIKGINQFSDITNKQFQQLFHMVRLLATQKDFIQIADFQYDTFDWSEKLLPPIVKNDRGLDLGHVFATVGVLEFWVNRKRQQANQTAKWITLSEQQIIDCCDDCSPGDQPHKVLKYIMQNGISSDQNYKYTSAIYNTNKQQCKTSNSIKPYRPIASFSRIKNCQELSLAIEKYPVVVGIDAQTLKDYQGGVVDDCGTKRSHYLMLVGKGVGYWKLKNSWGTRWGQKGYLRIKLGNTCAICAHGYLPVFNLNQ